MKTNKKILSIFLSLIAVLTVFSSCTNDVGTDEILSDLSTENESNEDYDETSIEELSSENEETDSAEKITETDDKAAPGNGTAKGFDISMVPEFSGSAYVAINNNIPYFDKNDITSESFEHYSNLDSMGRCGTASASVGKDLMPTEERGGIGMVKPSGWHTVKYDCVDGKYLYNRCHLIGYQLTAENANERNLITGTRYLNIKGMLPFENMTADYVKETGNHVMYRVTPVFEGNNLVADGVLMEGWSVEDEGEGVCFCIFAYNVQPGVSINYSNGDSTLDSSPVPETPVKHDKPAANGTPEIKDDNTGNKVSSDYVLNVRSKKFHRPDCSSVKKMKEENKEYYNGSRDELIARGYEPCKNCNP